MEQHRGIADNVSGNFQAAVDGFAAGALLVMLIDSMIPEAAQQAGKIAGLLTVLGFSVAAALSGIGGRSVPYDGEAGCDGNPRPRRSQPEA